MSILYLALGAFILGGGTIILTNFVAEQAAGTLDDRRWTLDV